MVESAADVIDAIVARTQEAMAEASEILLDGFRLRSDARVVRWPDRYVDDRGREFWARVMALLPAELEADERAGLRGVNPCGIERGPVRNWEGSRAGLGPLSNSVSLSGLKKGYGSTLV
jgi:hypothetical protein